MDRSPPGSSLQNGTNKQKGEESASQSNKAKLYCVNSRLSKLKECVCPEVGTWVLIFWNSQEQQSWWYMLSFVKFALWNGRYLSIIFSFPWFMVKIIYSPSSVFCLLARWTTGAGNGRQEGWDLAFEIYGSKPSSLQRPKIFLILYFLGKEIRYKTREMRVKKIPSQTFPEDSESKIRIFFFLVFYFFNWRIIAL